MKSIYATIRQEVNDYIRNPIYPVEGYSFYTYDTIKRAHLYENSQFATGLFGGSTSDPLNLIQEQDDRIFFNISNPRRDAVKRFTDVDIKDVSLEEINPISERPINLLYEDFRRFAERHNLSREFNKLNNTRCSFGSAVIETVGKPEEVDLRRLFLDPTVERIGQSRFVTVKYSLTPQELREKTKDGWDADKIEKIIALKGNSGNASESYEEDGNVNQISSSTTIDVYKRYGYFEEGLIKGGNSTKEVKSVVIVAEPFNQGVATDSQGNEYPVENGEVLFKSKWNKEWPFRDTHFIKTKGRWLGIGIFEILFPAQERMNEIANQRRISMTLSMMHLFQTADPTALNNLLNDLENGDIIQTKTPNAISQIATEERNLPAINLELQSYKELADSVTHANDLVTAGDVPSSTPATNVVVQNNNILSIHLDNREEFTNFISYYIKDFVIPQLLEETKNEHYVSIMSDAEDIFNIDETLVNLKMKQELMDKGMNAEFLSNPEGYKKKALQKIKSSGSKRYVKVMQDYYKKKIGDVIVHVDNEKKDMAKMANNTLAFYQITAGNENALLNPVSKLLLTSYARDIGIDTSKLELAFAKANQQMESQQERVKVPNIPLQEESTDQKEAKLL